jgi:hypothetical protein
MRDDQKGSVLDAYVGQSSEAHPAQALKSEYMTVVHAHNSNSVIAG